ncbi:oligopeptide/dipeptide ABC transporter ATP-binding protein [Breoghania corrubedonensis]|uniref:Oligopeptide/dipeptide ABC transporter ATP-binding protein n=1 Tax=Breoghania corrubedonensis TaxID=665038 RepID=A0A2T5VA19_9HYPH|nr:ABC transporter ATP-binding protein [Breoghania corrubedonensis]PTW60599.1 oligopeptide/dipeptide ABC transporter ATP-binding protein [Breoghania corrubedonensis]
MHSDADSNPSPLLAVDNLTLRFSSASGNVVDGVSFSVSPGETLCIVGESGCGKSVTALSLMGLLPMPPAQITAGSAMFDGKDLLRMPRREMAAIRGNRMAMIFQEPMTSLNPAYRIGDQIAEVVLRHRPVTRKQARARALEMLDRVKIPAAVKRLDDYPHQLSGGMRQRVMIAMALANDPALLIADEPTTALDVTIQAQILQLIRTLQEETGTALIMITHDLGVVAEVGDRVAVMYAGRIVEQGSVDDVFIDPQHPYTLGLMSSIPSLSKREGRLTTIPGMVPTVDTMPPGCRFAPRCPFAGAECKAAVPPLTDLSPGHAAACIRAPLEAEAHFDGAVA